MSWAAVGAITPSKDPAVLTIACDIADPLTAQRIVDDGSAKFGRIETLINNAGLFMSKPFTEYTPDTHPPTTQQ